MITALRIAAIENGADKIRINPGNIGSSRACAGSGGCGKRARIFRSVSASTVVLWKKIWWRNIGGVTAEGIVESALDKVHMIEDMGYDNLVISIKSSDVMMCVKAHELIAKQTDYPLHVGITEVRNHHQRQYQIFYRTGTHSCIRESVIRSVYL